MVQWMEQQFCKSNTIVPMLCEKLGAILLVLEGLTADQQTDTQADEILEILIFYRLHHSVIIAFTNAFQQDFSDKACI